MSRLAAFLAALWLSSVVAHPGFFSTLKQVAISVKNFATNEVQAGIQPIWETVAIIGDSLCKRVRPIAGQAYENYNEVPDMSKLTLIFKTSAKTVIYNLTQALEEFPKERWFDPKLPIRFYFHGFIDNPMKNSFQTMSSAFFGKEASKGQMNLLALDASSLIAYFYLRSSTMVQFLGERLGKTLAALIPTGVDPKNIHLIGHSLGSHIAGFTGQTFLSLTGSRVGRISGLDPAGPCFGNVHPSLRLSKDDADFVDVIHTDAAVYGLDENIGHVDFWPNNGAEQPNYLLQTCSHSRAWEIYAQSVQTPEAFIAVKCKNDYEFRHGQCDYNDTSVMGYGTPTNTRGSYYCQTLGEEPYAIGAMGLIYKNTAIVRKLSNAVKDIVIYG